jgi:hypothetical protein
MRKALKVLGGLTLALGCVAMAGAQQPAPHMYDYCLKVNPGNTAALDAHLQNVESKLGQVLVDSGRLLAWASARAIAPVGESARCDYHVFAQMAGFPAQPPLAPPAEADLKKAGLAMSVQQVLEKRQSLVKLVSVNLWRVGARVGQVEQGNYLRVNYYKTSDANEWIQLESTGWKKLVEEASKDMPGLAWGAATLRIPEGDNLPYNASSYDAYPSWEALGNGIPMRKYWNKAHPNTDVTSYLNRISDVIERPMTDVIRMEHVIRKK